MEKDSSEIVKLTERISKDPKSKLFVPLAEEYKKIGDVEMAVYVLTEGLKNNPSYVTARAILGRLLLDQGDLAGAQKELLEVVKVIPDNLLAQRKLGDICVLQARPDDALKHYKIVLALNPRDEEIASLVSDIEAGQDVSSRLPQPKGQPVAAAVKPLVTSQAKPPIAPPLKQEAKPQPHQASPAPQAQAAPIPTPAPSAETPPAQETLEPVPASAPPFEQPAAILTPSVAEIPAPAAIEKIEEPEEIFMVEPLEKEKPEQEARVIAPVVPAEPEQPTEQAIPEPEPVREPDVIAAHAGGTEIAETPIRAEKPASRTEPVEETSTEKSDDFTTDTLAELYIAQGFYEKAIDIYERMLVDNPTSRGLKDKLARVREMASASAGEAGKPAADIFSEPRVYSAQEEAAEEGEKPRFFAEPEKERPVAAPAEATWQEPVREAVEPEILAPASEQKAAQAKPMYTDFEPREYTPPREEAELVEAKAAPVEEKPERARAATKSPTAIRKDTIERLESWLKNIKKES